MENKKTREAVEILVEALKNDEDYYYAWQANIAMSFMDEIDSDNSLYNMYNWVDKDSMHRAANEAAKNFLNLLIK